MREQERKSRRRALSSPDPVEIEQVNEANATAEIVQDSFLQEEENENEAPPNEPVLEEPTLEDAALTNESMQSDESNDTLVDPDMTLISLDRTSEGDAGPRVDENVPEVDHTPKTVEMPAPIASRTRRGSALSSKNTPVSSASTKIEETLKMPTGTPVENSELFLAVL